MRNAAKAYLSKSSGALRKMAGASMIKAAHEMGRSAEQVGMSQKHVHSLIGRPGWDGTSDFANANSLVNDTNHHLGLAHDRHAELAEAVHDQDASAIKDAHEAVLQHLDAAHASAKHTSSVMDAALRERGSDSAGGPSATKKADHILTPEGNELDLPLIKGHLAREGDRLRLYVPFAKVTEFKTASGDALMVEGCASVADYIDDQNDIPDAGALERAMEKWSPFGNIRLQHKVDKPVGTIRQPVVGELPAGVAKPGWWMAIHPTTGTKAAYIRAHIVDPETVKLIKAGVMTGFSIGGSVTDSRDVMATTNELGVVQGMEAIAT